MFDSLNDEIRKSEAPVKPADRLLLYGGVAIASIVVFCGLYLGILFME